MKFLEPFGEVVKSVFNIRLEISTLREQQAEDRKRVNALDTDFEQLGREMQALRERLVRLETQRDADLSEMRTDLERFKLEVERAMLRAERQKQIGGQGGDEEAGS